MFVTTLLHVYPVTLNNSGELNMQATNVYE